ncbi:MAG: glycoside hydrolase TIM-barrel-like domain-containing protein [Hyphomonadaceae bacterium]|nr:glycoside hydrolase TIM-barrel-like domain-containing protein [Hyphomonadaceae bacterium]
MAELVLGRAGAAIGAALLPKGLSFLGGMAGRLAGGALDARYLSPPVQGPRVKDFHLTEGREGAGIPVVYGRCRVGGQLIWAADFKERRDVEGGKGGPRVANYSYSLSFAVALCEGEVTRVARCWANGEPFDLSQVTWRLHSGSEEQAPDPLIEAVEGAASAPAYRGVAYIVFEDMPVDQFGARMPQLSFEVIRPAAGAGDRLETMARAVNMIPGSGEFALATDIVRRRLGPGREVAENQHGPELKSDFEASLDQLEAELPNVSRVNLVVGWFGSDLRCGECLIRPGVEVPAKTTIPLVWSVAGIERGDAYVVSNTDDRANYGGTPSDNSVQQAIEVLKARGYHVTLYPFLLMDIAAGNGLPDPYGAAEQAAFPWRGRIRTVAGDVDAQVEQFFDRYRAFILHYAEMAESIGADGILIGSELIGLTRTVSGGVYPAVLALRDLAQDVRAIVGPGVEISYAADWTEYGAHVVGGDVAFPLDALWADTAIDYVGLDWYAPMADWRDGDGHADAAAKDGRSLAYLGANIAAGEAFDWYYPDDAARTAQDRVAISDGAYAEPWVFRQKDVSGWWSSAHHPRAGGVRSSTPTAWAAGMKPVRFVEMGCPAVDKGANQPNVFYDPKSSESGLPHFSDGSRDDVVQRRAIEAFHAYWRNAENNPVSSVYGEPMTPDDGAALWAWDARPFPAFPARDDAWGDAGNWRLGHWLNGRVGLALLSDVVADVCERVGVDAEVGGLSGIVPG